MALATKDQRRSQGNWKILLRFLSLRLQKAQGPTMAGHFTILKIKARYYMNALKIAQLTSKIKRRNLNGSSIAPDEPEIL
jgi:hypothetical protein